MKVLKGGPVETERGFVLHSNDFFIENSTLPIDDGICLTATLDILKAIARGNGPANAVLALGYAGWAPGQLENEIHQNGWLHCSADSELVFGQDNDGKYNKALKKIGIDLGMLSAKPATRDAASSSRAHPPSRPGLSARRLQTWPTATDKPAMTRVRYAHAAREGAEGTCR